jgi:hypothetical protein
VHHQSLLLMFLLNQTFVVMTATSPFLICTRVPVYELGVLRTMHSRKKKPAFTLTLFQFKSKTIMKELLCHHVFRFCESSPAIAVFSSRSLTIALPPSSSSSSSSSCSSRKKGHSLGRTRTAGGGGEKRSGQGCPIGIFLSNEANRDRNKFCAGRRQK